MCLNHRAPYAFDIIPIIRGIRADCAGNFNQTHGKRNVVLVPYSVRGYNRQNLTHLVVLTTGADHHEPAPHVRIRRQRPAAVHLGFQRRAGVELAVGGPHLRRRTCSKPPKRLLTCEWKPSGSAKHAEATRKARKISSAEPSLRLTLPCLPIRSACSVIQTTCPDPARMGHATRSGH